MKKGPRAAMRVIIDGYNLLKSIDTMSSIAKSRIQNVERIIAQRASSKGYNVWFVLDGGVTSIRHEERIGCLMHVEVGYGKSADEYIKEFLRENCALELCVIVTADRELIASLEGASLYTIDPLPYWFHITRCSTDTTSKSGSNVSHGNVIRYHKDPCMEVKTIDGSLKKCGASTEQRSVDAELLMRYASEMVCSPKEVYSDLENDLRERKRTGLRLSRSDRIVECIMNKL